MILRCRERWSIAAADGGTIDGEIGRKGDVSTVRPQWPGERSTKAKGIAGAAMLKHLDWQNAGTHRLGDEARDEKR
ncbi:MAG TPA: hypothetical protein VJQ54_01885 [Candidatus Sulfotelmatobacter sp.]|nr:hypothetical protein [Candidatus Sulfotelmatobacter sp.]